MPVGRSKSRSNRIIFTAAPPHIPPALVAQVKRGGRMVIPVTRADGDQLMLVTKGSVRRVSTRALLAVHFIPLTRPRD
jgi:protein-L-isoaspartate(D-aspartate) O-methyltransferase